MLKISMIGFYFERVDPFIMPPKLYGAVTYKMTDRMLETFLNRTGSTGVVLSGEKGSGKSLLVKYTANTAVTQGIPVIIISSPFTGDAFNSLIQNIKQPAVLLFDEFEKVYTAEQQEQLLTLLDGMFTSQKLILFTTNDKWRIDRHMRNRPGRIFYMADFHGVEETFIREYCEDNLRNKKYIESVVRISTQFSAFNFDMLKSLVEEMNRYNESPGEALELLNIRPEYEENKKLYNIALFYEETEIPVVQVEWRGNPYMSELDVYPLRKKKEEKQKEGEKIFDILDEDDEDDDSQIDAEGNWYTLMEAGKIPSRLRFRPSEIIDVLPERITFESRGFQLVLTPKKEDSKKPNWHMAF